MKTPMLIRIMARGMAGLTVAGILLVSVTGCGDTGGRPSSTDTVSETVQPETTAADKLEVAYAGGEGAAGEAPASKSVKPGEEIMLPECPFQKEGAQFAGWTDGSNTYQPADFYKVEKDVTFTAVWEETPSKLVLGNMDSMDGGWEGFPECRVVTQGAREGTGYLEVTFNSDIVFRTETISYNLAPYMETGVLHVSVYVKDHSVITGGQIELTSSGVADSQELSVGEFGSGILLASGWNDLEIPLSSFKEVGGAPALEAMNYVRVYFLVSGEATIGVDDMYITL